MQVLIGILIAVFLIIMREMDKSEIRKMYDKAKDKSYIYEKRKEKK